MIEKLQDGEFRNNVFKDKINEIIDEIEALKRRTSDHYHMVFTTPATSEGHRTSVALEDKE